MKTVAISEDTWRKLKELKEKMKASSFDDVINVLIETWHFTSLKEELSKVNLKISYYEAREFITTMRELSSREKQSRKRMETMP